MANMLNNFKKLEIILIELRIAGESIKIHDLPVHEIWREAERKILAVPKPFRLAYALVYRDIPLECGIWSGECNIPIDFEHGDFARRILNICSTGGEVVKDKSQKGKEIVMNYYTAFREKHQIIVTH